ncbi:HET-D protein [Clohesyomyces aquaticus]|uniref:HET-D protein n=1 Tax=Clohesyomyces aquaticus TaxID=1231657 RepID=A0A1Y1ZLT2_9PLEO|nr:HET-D protein [Clohesyomyces aquaticus]
MRLLRRSGTGDFSLTPFSDDAIPPYAILSHTWGADTEEVTFDDLTNGTGKNKAGYEKIQFCREQAALDDLEYFWIDTCCINKADKPELSQAIKSMFRWYRNATRCYVYLSDVSTTSIPPNRKKNNEDYNPLLWESDFRKSRWFTRGWTLQELLAPCSVTFYSRERKRLGDKSSLGQHIHEITGIPTSALQGSLLSQFTVNERLSWREHRQTKLKEDMAYSLQGIFGVYVAPIYGEGAATAFKRLMGEIDKLENCIQHLRLTDPRDDKKRIEGTKGGLLDDSYRWILENSEFRQWRNDPQSRLLWIKGDPGKGKTMLLCGIINELSKSIRQTHQLSYFFCQATDSRINNATAVVRGLLYLLISQQPHLVSHIQKYDHAGKALFEDANAWVVLSEIFAHILQDLSLNSTYLAVDALDECVTDLPKVLDFIVLMSSISSRVKWIVSSRNEAYIEQKLQLNDSGIRLSLELKENAAQVSHAVHAYIDHCLSELPEIAHDQLLQDSVRDKMQQKANGTFLWVSLVIQELKKVPEGMMGWEARQILEEVPTDLKDVYRRMIEQITRLRSQYPELCRQVLSTVLATYRPLHLQELHVLSGLPTKVQNVNQATTAIVKMCGSFLTIREANVYIIHQSARDFLSKEAKHELVPYGIGNVHQSIFSRSLQVMSTTLRRDIYSLGALGFSAKNIKPPDLDPLAASRYSCIYWVNHLCDWKSNSSADHSITLQDIRAIDNFIREKYLYWLEALSLCKSISEGVVSMERLEAVIQVIHQSLNLIVKDARRFIMYHKLAIENSPLQTYASALVFSPKRSLIRDLFKKEEPKWITMKPAIGDAWGACLSTLEGHSETVRSVAFSHDSTRLASASDDCTVKIWDASSGACLSTLEGHSETVRSVAFSHDSTRLASASDDCTVKIWDASSGACLSTLEGHSGEVTSVAFSHDSTRLASASGDCTVKIWDASSGACLSTLEGHSGEVRSVAFSHDSTRLASASGDCTVKIWDASSGACLSTLEGHSQWVTSVAFSHDSTRLASASGDCTVKIWDASSGACLSTLEGHSQWVTSVAFSHDSTRLASASGDCTVKIWDASSGACLSTLEGHSQWVTSVAFSHDSTRLASASYDCTVKIWDASSGACLSTLDVGSALENISFDATGLYLYTTRGTISINATGLVSTPIAIDPQTPEYKGLGLSSDRTWITHDSKKLVWLPSEYRPMCLAAALGKTIGIGVGTGRVSIFEFQPNIG